MATITTVEVERLSHTGEGIASVDGVTTLVRGALPGERVRAEIVHSGKVGRANTLEVLSASDARVTPACPHAARCGGCDLMHASPQLQRTARRRAVIEQLSAIAEIPEPVVHEPSPALGYRSRARLRVHATGGAVQVGFHRPRSRKLAAIDACVILREELAEAVPLLGALVAGSRGTGDAQVALGDERKIAIDLRWNGRLDPGTFARSDKLVFEGVLAGVRLWEGEAAAPATFGDPRACIAGVDGEPLWIPPGGFAQASEEGGKLLAERVGALCAKRPGGLTIELFAGSGTLTVAALPHAERYIAVEQHEAAAEALRENLRARDMKAKIVVADANDYDLKRPLATVVLDPPRAGAAGACAKIAAARPRQIVYVSCNPATLARDLGALTGYRVKELEIVELFPQTSHVETIARLERA